MNNEQIKESIIIKVLEAVRINEPLISNLRMTVFNVTRAISFEQSEFLRINRTSLFEIEKEVKDRYKNDNRDFEVEFVLTTCSIINGYGNKYTLILNNIMYLNKLYL